MKQTFRSLIAVLAVVSVTAAACGSSSKTRSAAPTTAAAAPTTVSPLTGSVTVLAAASLTEAFNDAKTKLVASHPGLSLTYSFAGSQALVQQIQNGAPAD